MCSARFFRWWFSGAIGVLVVLLGACVHDVSASLDSVQARALWAQKSSGNYDYLVVRKCYCLQEYTRSMWVQVRQGKVVAAAYEDTGGAVPQSVLEDLRTIDGWFAYIEKALAKPFFKLQIHYHAQLGYPQQLVADVHERIADDEQTITISQVRLLP